MSATEHLTRFDESVTAQSRGMLNRLEKLQSDAALYREAVDQVFSPAVTTAKKWQECLYQVLISTAKLYLDYVLIQNDVPILEPIASKRARFRMVSTNNDRESRLRKDLRERLNSSESWPGFVPRNPFSETTGLRNIQDYESSLTLHLPEIYEESFRIETCAKAFLESHSSSALAQLSVGLQHLGRNHVSFVLPTLEWAADEGSWNELPEERP